MGEVLTTLIGRDDVTCWVIFGPRSAGIDQAADLGRLSENVISHRPNRQENRVSPCRSRREKQPLSAYWLLESARRDLLKGLDPLDLVPCLNLVQPTGEGLDPLDLVP